MDSIPEKLLKFKLPLLIVAVSSLFVGLFIYLAPRFIDIIKYFWPLLLSTALFLVAIVVFGRVSPPPHAEASGENAGEGLLEFVAGSQESQLPPQLNERFEEEEEEEEEEDDDDEDEVALREAAAKAKGKAKADD